MRRKSLVGVLSALLIFGAFLPQVSASGQGQVKKEEVTQKVKEIIKQDTNVEIIDPSELPEGIPMLNFDTVEDFEKYVKEHGSNMDNNHEKFDPKMNEKDAGTHPENGGKPTDFSALSSSIGLIRWADWNWWETSMMVMTFNYSYYSAGGYNYFSGVSNIKSGSENISPVNWNQTNSSSMIMDGSRTLQLKISGYHLFGANIAGFPLGFRAYESYTKYFYRSQIN